MEIIEKVLDWPVIVQGALGSFLFWLLLASGQKLGNALSKKFNSDKNVANYFPKAYFASEVGDKFKLVFFASSMYGVLHYFIKSVLVILISVMLGELIPVFETVGFLIAAYFLFRALSYVPHFDSFGTKEQAKKDLGWDDPNKNS